MVHYCHFKKKIRSLDPRDPILWPPENSRQIRDDRDSRLPAILLISDFLNLNFSKGHQIVTIGARDKCRYNIQIRKHLKILHLMGQKYSCKEFDFATDYVANTWRHTLKQHPDPSL